MELEPLTIPLHIVGDTSTIGSYTATSELYENTPRFFSHIPQHDARTLTGEEADRCCPIAA
jgi:hypothetical protein